MTIHPVARDAATAEFFDGTRSGELLLWRNRKTGEYREPRAVLAPAEEADFERVRAGGGGWIVSWAVVPSKAAHDYVESGTVVGIVELDEGPWWWTRLIVVDPTAELVGARVRVTFVPSGDEPDCEVIPMFTSVVAEGES